MSGTYRRAAAALRSLRDVIRFGVSRFGAARLAFGHGSDNAIDEATYLAAHKLALPLDRIDQFLDARLTPEEIRGVLDLFERRVLERRPAAYLTGEAWIGSHRFQVDERVIVPRSFIGHWLCGDLLPWIPEPERIGRVLELCTGSGCLAVLAALALPRAQVTAIDLSADALEVAARNVADYDLGARITLAQSDLFAALDNTRYDLILANPPYVTAPAMEALPQEYRHEPRIALAGGDDGLDVVRRILAQAQRHLLPGGLLMMEVGHARARVEAVFPRIAFTWVEIDAVDDAVFVLPQAQLPHARRDHPQVVAAPRRRRTPGA